MALDLTKDDGGSQKQYKLLPEGIYSANLVGIEVKDSQKGAKYLAPTFEVIDANEHNGAKIFDVYMLEGKGTSFAIQKIKQLFKAIGETLPASINNEKDFRKLFFKDVKIKIVHQIYNDKTRASVDCYLAANSEDTPF